MVIASFFMIVNLKDHKIHCKHCAILTNEQKLYHVIFNAASTPHCGIFLLII
jgi:hypothetical protein